MREGWGAGIGQVTKSFWHFRATLKSAHSTHHFQKTNSRSFFNHASHVLIPLGLPSGIQVGSALPFVLNGAFLHLFSPSANRYGVPTVHCL